MIRVEISGRSSSRAVGLRGCEKGEVYGWNSVAIVRVWDVM